MPSPIHSLGQDGGQPFGAESTVSMKVSNRESPTGHRRREAAGHLPTIPARAEAPAPHGEMRSLIVSFHGGHTVPDSSRIQ